MSVTRLKVHAIIFCWPGKKANALHIAKGLVGHADRVTVIDACGIDEQPAVPPSKAFEWRHVPSSWYYGAKFTLALEVFEGDVMLQIQADATSDDWPGIAAACRKAFDSDLPIGVWAADVAFTYFPTADVTLYRDPATGYCVVSQTDCIVWALAGAVVERMRKLTFAQNPLGWGADTAALCLTYGCRQIAVRDCSVRVQHPRGRGYDTSAAEKQLKAFLDQLDPNTRALSQLLGSHSFLNGMGVRGLLDQNKAVLRRQITRRLGIGAADPALSGKR